MAGGGGGGGEYDVHLNLVPLIDILCNILFFLLMSFASQEMKYEGNLELPSAGVNADADPVFSITVTKDELLVDKVRVAKVKDSKLDAPGKATRSSRCTKSSIPSERRRKRKRPRSTRRRMSCTCSQTSRRPSPCFRPVMKTAAMAGYPNFRFAVVKK